MKTYEVYKVTNNINNKIYVGITNQGYKTRFYKHCSDSIRGSNFPLHLALRKYGIDNFTTEVIETCDTIELLKEREIHWIKTLQSQSKEIGYNVTSGGDGAYGIKVSDVTRNKMSLAAKGRVISDITKNNMRKACTKSKKVSMFTLDGTLVRTFNSTKEADRELGYTNTNISRCARGLTAAYRGYIWKYDTDYKPDVILEKVIELKPVKSRVVVMTDEIKKKISDSNKATFSDPARRLKRSQNNPKNRVIVQYTLDGILVKEYNSVADAVREIGAKTHTNIAKCARGIRNKAEGFVWKYKE